MPGVQTLMPVMLNHINDGKLSLNQLMNFVCENPVKIFGIKNKGFIKEGFDADFTIAILGYIFFKQTLAWQAILGLFLIVIGVILVNSFTGRLS